MKYNPVSGVCDDMPSSNTQILSAGLQSRGYSAAKRGRMAVTETKIDPIFN